MIQLPAVPRAIRTVFLLALGGAAQPPGPPFSQSLWSSAGHDLDTAYQLSQAQLAQPVRSESGVLALLALAIVAAFIVWPVRLWLLGLLKRLIHRFDRHGHCHRPAKAVITVLLTVLLIGFAVHIVRSSLDVAIMLLPATRALADTAAAGLVVTGLGLGVGRALRSPDDPSQRPIETPDGLDKTIGLYPLLGGIALGLAGFIERTSAILHASPTSWMLAQGLLIVLETILIASFLVSVGRSRDRDHASGGQPRSASLTLTALAWSAILIGLVAFLLGYTRFSVLLFQEMIWSSLVVVVATLCVRLVSGLLAWSLGTEHAAGHFATHIIGLKPERITQVSILSMGAATLLIWMVAVGLVLAPLGGEGVSLVDQVQPELLLGELRTLHFAPQAVATALVVLIVGVTLTRIVRRWLERRFLPATSLDIGVRSSIVTGLSYAGIVLALLAATNALGINLDKITLIASALSVGIGFGLQSIIQNFVSGVILLIERPIKVGDWVLASGAEGSVQRINVRATELAAPDGSVTIVPNSLFISANVQNRSGAGVSDRVELMVKVAGSPTPEQARDAILDILQMQSTIKREPGPRLLLTDASDAGFGFTVQAYGDATRPMAELRSELVYALVGGFVHRDMKVAIS